MIALTKGGLKPAQACAKIESFIRQRVALAGASGVVIGLSGGIDSALVAKLCVGALGKERVFALLLPEDWHNTEVAESYARELGVKHAIVNITPLVKMFEVAGKRAELGERGNLKIASANLRPRVRMTMLYHRANALGRLVVGTGNKSELLTGYFTKYGDGGVDLLPIGGLYKTHVRQLAQYLKLPKAIQQAPPTAGLWRGQTDEGEMGIDYSTLDKLLYQLHDLKRGPTQAAKATGATLAQAVLVKKLTDRAGHKLSMPPVCDVDKLTL